MTMTQRKFPLLVIAVLLLIAGAGSVLAQEATPEPTPEATSVMTVPEAEVIGEGDPEALRVVREYLETRDPALLAEDAVLYTTTDGMIDTVNAPLTTEQMMSEPFGAAVRGREEITRVQDNVYLTSFSGGVIQPVRFIQADNVVVAESLFTGVHSGPYGAAPATGMSIAVPMIGIFEVENGQITSIRSTMDTGLLYNQVGYGAGAGLGVAPGVASATGMGLTAYTDTMRAVFEDPNAYYGQPVVVEGLVGRALSDNAFVLRENGALGSEELVVLDASENGLSFFQLADTPVLIEGTLQPFDAATIEQQTGMAPEQADVDAFQGGHMLLATSARNLDNVETVANITTDPMAFYGQEVVIHGNVGEAVGNDSFVLYEGSMRLLVVKGAEVSADFVQVADAYVRVAGTLVQDGVAGDLASAAGREVDMSAFGDYADLPVLVANSIVNTEDVETVALMADNPDSFTDHDVTVVGVVDGTAGPQAFWLRDDPALGLGNQRILVVTAQSNRTAFDPAQESRVRVSGTVQAFDAAQVQGAYDLTADDPALADYTGPVLVADRVTAVHEDEPVG